MAFKMKNPSMAKMAKMAGDNRAAMKMKMESAAKMKKAAPMKKDSRSLLDRAKDEGKQLMAGAKAAGRVLSDKVYFRPKKAVQDAVKAYKKEEDRQAAERKSGSTKSPGKMKKSAMKMKEPMKMKKGEPMKLKEKDSAAKFNAKLKAASKAGKLSGKFKEAVDASPAKMKKPMKMKKAAMKMNYKK